MVKNHLKLENETVKKARSPQKKFNFDINDDLDLAISKFGKLKLQKSFRESILMDTLYVLTF